MNNKIKFGLKKLAIALITEKDDGTIDYEKPIMIPGAKSITLSPVGELIEIEGDDQPDYYSTNTNSGYDGSVEVNNLPDEVYTSILGEELDKNKVQFENSDAQPKRFAMLFEISGDVRKTRFCFYNVLASRPNIESKTKGKSFEATTDTLTITARPSQIDGRVKSKTIDGTPKDVYEKWYDAVPKFVEEVTEA